MRKAKSGISTRSLTTLMSRVSCILTLLDSRDSHSSSCNMSVTLLVAVDCISGSSALHHLYFLFACGCIRAPHRRAILEIRSNKCLISSSLIVAVVYA